MCIGRCAPVQVMCDKCDKKTDAVKGIMLDELPDILMLQLKRFDFDLMTLRRVKLNDRVGPTLFARAPVGSDVAPQSHEAFVPQLRVFSPMPRTALPMLGRCRSRFGST